MLNFFRNKSRTGPRVDKDIREHLERENPVLKEVVDGFFQLDFLLHSIGYLKKSESLTKKMSWWPVISILGTYSAGKSSFINYYLDYPIQETGVQAVDDKFTVICYSAEKEVRTLPGFALDSDPRFPFYKISKAIDEVSPGEGAYLDSYLQLKTCPSDKIKGKIFIDSPGFDADEKRASILRITDRIIDLSDLVLIFFDARHPEPGSMKDTLEHLVKNTVKRRDSNKFLYILNQIDVTAKEDNLEAVFASWQRALVRYGVSAGRYFCIYNPIACNVIEDPETRKRYERKRDQDLNLISKRIEDVKIERTYRLIGLLKDHVKKLQNIILPNIYTFREKLKKYTLILDSISFGIIILAIHMGHSIFTETGSFQFWIGIIKGIFTSLTGFIGFLFFLVALFCVHSVLKKKIGDVLAKRLIEDFPEEERERYLNCFLKNGKWYAPIFRKYPTGWSERLATSLKKLNSDVNIFIQKLNQEYTDPSGKNL
ncbi:hypothetical protein JCM13304A_09550 [Desulfothermus okinawensis JCM 13304]